MKQRLSRFIAMAIATVLFGETLALQLIPIASAADTNTETQVSVGTSFRENFSSASSVNRRFITKQDGVVSGSIYRASNALVASSQANLYSNALETYDGKIKTGGIASRYQYTYGTYTLRAKANPTLGMVSAMSLKNDAGSSRNEIQIAMSAKRPEVLSLISYKDGKSTTSFKNIREIAGLQSFDSRKNNTYRITWSEGSIIWYVNGKRIEQFTSQVPAGPLRLNLETTSMTSWPEFAGDIISGEGSFGIDWVQVSQKRTVSAPVVTTPVVTTPAAPPAPVVVPQPAPVVQPAPTPASAPVATSVKIIGDQNCVTKTNAALNLLKTKAAPDYERIQKYIGVIECVPKGSGMWAWESPPRYTVGLDTLNADLTWYAGTIAHDSCHSVQYNDYKAAHPGQGVPASIYSGEAAEAECLGVQYEALKRLGASASTLSYVKSVIGTQYWTGSYENRSW